MTITKITFGALGSMEIATVTDGAVDRGSGAVLPGRYIDGAWVATDLSKYPDEVQQAAAEHWTADVIAACKAACAAAAPSKTVVDRERDRRFTLGAPIDLGSGRTFVADIDDRSVTNITALALDATRAQAAGDTTTIDFRDHANTVQTLSPADVIAMAEQAMARVSAIYAASWVLKAMDPIPADYAADSRWPAN